MPFWQKTTFAPVAAILLTMFLSMDSSWSMKDCICSGSVMLIFASISVLRISSGESMSAIFALRTSFGMLACVTSLSRTMPSMSCVSSTLPPVFFSSLILFVLKMNLLFSFSMTLRTACMATVLMRSAAISAPLPVMAVSAICLSFSVSFSLTGSAIALSIWSAFSAARR